MNGGTSGPVGRQQRTGQLMHVLPDERKLWKELQYFPFSDTWDERQEKLAAMEYTREKFVVEYTQTYKQQQQQQQQMRIHDNSTAQTSSSSFHNKKRQRPHRKKKRQVFDDDDDDQDYGVNQEQEYDPDDYANAVARSALTPNKQDDKVTATATTTSSLSSSSLLHQQLQAEVDHRLVPFLDFLQALPECEPLTAGFLLLPLSDQKACFCPCSRRLRAWRNQDVWKNNNNQVQQRQQQQPQPTPPYFFQECDKGRNNSSAFHALGIMAHVRDLKNNGDWWHWIIHEYLNRLFKNYMGKDRPHRALLPPHDKQYNAAKRLELSAIEAHINNLSESEEAHKQKLADLRLQTAQLGKQCKHLEIRLDQQRRFETALSAILAASWESFSPTDVSDDEVRQYQNKRDGYFYIIRKALSSTEPSLSGIRLSIPQEGFNLQNVFEANSTMFLETLSPRGAAQWLRPLNVEFDFLAPDTGRAMTGHDLSAIDHGGPTRQFLSEAFLSIHKRKVSFAGKETTLWFQDKETGFYFPMEDDTILHNLGLWDVFDPPHDRAVAYDKARSMIRPLARAIGRLIFYCMANVIEKDDEFQKTDQRLHINSYIFPEIYLYFLLADVKPTSNDYPLGDLVKFLSEHSRLAKKDIVWKEDKDFENMKERLIYYIESCLGTQPSEDDDLHESIQQLRDNLRKAAERDFIDNRRLVLLAVREGMSLDDTFDYIETRLFTSQAPVEVIRRMFLVMPLCNVEDVIKCLKPNYTDEYPEYVGFQKQLLRIETEDSHPVGHLPDILKKICQDEPSMAGTFVFFATGMRCIPYQDDYFRILIDFTFCSPHAEDGGVTEDMLPWAHTCPRDVCFPGFAYNGDANELREKLSKALECAHYFTFE